MPWRRLCQLLEGNLYAHAGIWQIPETDQTNLQFQILYHGTFLSTMGSLSKGAVRSLTGTIITRTWLGHSESDTHVRDMAEPEPPIAVQAYAVLFTQSTVREHRLSERGCHPVAILP